MGTAQFKGIWVNCGLDQPGFGSKWLRPHWIWVKLSFIQRREQLDFPAVPALGNSYNNLKQEVDASCFSWCLQVP